MKIPIIVLSPPYDPSNGGSIVLHKLVDILNSINENAYIFPYFPSIPYDHEDPSIALENYEKTKIYIRNYNINNNFNTPLLNADGMDMITKSKIDHITIYPEIIWGNPLNSKKVVRWLLHHPGFHTGKVNYLSGEYYIKFSESFNEINIYNSLNSQKTLYLLHYFNELYNMPINSHTRSGSAYSIRKGTIEKISHDPNTSILIDGLSHEEISMIFKNVKYFISYDIYSMYSVYAAMCGCISVVVPQNDLPIDKWHPEPSKRLGIAYGFENIEFAQSTQKLLIEKISKSNNMFIQNTKEFISDVYNYFKQSKDC